MKDLDRIAERQAAPLTYEGCVVRVADKIAYLGRDIEDAITAGLITIDDVPDGIKVNLGSTNGEIIDALVMDVVNASAGNNEIAFSDDKYQLICQLKDFNYARIYNHPTILESDRSIRGLLEQLYRHLMESFQKNGLDGTAYTNGLFRVDQHFGNFLKKRKNLYLEENHPERSVVDFLAGMTDSFALESANEILFPKPIGRP